jgi:hypothetical protein
MRGACDAIVIGWIKTSSRHSEKLTWEMEHQSHRRRRIEIKSTKESPSSVPSKGAKIVIVKPQTRFLPWSLKCPRQGSFARSNTVEKNRIPLVSWVVSIPGSHCTILAGRHLMNQCQEIGDKYRKKKKKRDWLSWNSENALYARFTFLYALMSEINANWSSSS